MIIPEAAAIGISHGLGTMYNKARDKVKDVNKTMPMTKEDAKVINSKEFKKASEATVDKKKGGVIKDLKKGGSTASKRADGCAVRGKTKGKMC